MYRAWWSMASWHGCASGDSAFGAFLYYRMGRDLLSSVDLGLRSRAQAVEDLLVVAGAQGG